jgi:putative inorganic carbon (hco3(-)) transporter
MPNDIAHQLKSRWMLPIRFIKQFLNIPPDRPLKYAAFIALACAIAFVLVSIAISGIFLAIAAILFCCIWFLSPKSTFRLPAFALPLAIFFFWTVITALASPQIKPNLISLKKFSLFLILFLVPWIARRQKLATWIYHAVFLMAAVTALKGLAQFIEHPENDLLHRITGFMSHWMTFSGLLMLALVSLFSYALCFKRLGRAWVIVLGLLLTVVLVLTKTRNTCFGAVVGMITVFMLILPQIYAPFQSAVVARLDVFSNRLFGRVLPGALLRSLGIILFLAIIIGSYKLAPFSIKQRFSSAFDTGDANTKNRVELFYTSLRVIKHNVWLGVGQRGVQRAALQYRGSHEFHDWGYQHLHDNFLQIAAERGIPGLVLWLWLMGRLGWDAFLVYRSARKIPVGPDNEALHVSIAALGAWMALMISGFFEYNFGDAEVLTLFLFIMACPYAVMARTHPQAPAQ